MPVLYLEISSRRGNVEISRHQGAKTGQLLSNHVSVETDRNVRRFDRKGKSLISYNAEER